MITLSTRPHRLISSLDHLVGAGEQPWRHDEARALDDDISPCAGDYGLDLCLLGCGNSKLVESLLEIVKKGLPFGSCNPEMLVRLLHRASRILLRSTGSPADHFCDEVLEAWWGNSMMGLVYLWICIQAGIDHDPVDEVIDHGGNAVDAAEPLIKAASILGGHWCLLLIADEARAMCGLLFDLYAELIGQCAPPAFLALDVGAVLLRRAVHRPTAVGDQAHFHVVGVDDLAQLLVEALDNRWRRAGRR